MSRSGHHVNVQQQLRNVRVEKFNMLNFKVTVLQQVELKIISGSIASRGASGILRRLRITQGRGKGSGTLEFQENSLLQYRGYLKIQENKLKACSIVKETLYTSIRSHCESP
jgi:hypothetical protein